MENQLPDKECYIFCSVCAYPVAHCETDNKKLICPRCGCKCNSYKNPDTQKTFIYALTALILYFPANMLPFMTFEMYGNKTQATIWGGIIKLAEGGSWFLALVVFLASMLVPFIKILALFYLSLTAHTGQNQKFKTKLYHFLEKIGSWAMLDVFLMAVLVAIVKLDSMASVTVGDGSFLFLFVVIFTLLASASFDSKVIWEGVPNEKD